MIPAKTLLALAALSFVPIQCIDLDVSDSGSIKSAATTIAKDLAGYYTANLTKPGQAIGLLDAPYYFWETGAMFDTLIQYWRLTGDSQFNDLVIQGLAAQQGTNQDFMPANQSKSEGNDDQSFWALAAMSAAEANLGEASNTSWVTLADNVFNEQAARWDDQSCGGGIRWQIYSFNTGYTYKNSLANGNFFQLAARLAAYTGNSTYSDWASKAYNWSSTIGFVSTNGAVYDGGQTTSNCSSINKLQWSSSAGTFIAGSAHMYNLTSGSEQWKNTLDTLLNTTTSTFFSGGIATEVACESNNLCNTDEIAFKGILGQALVNTIKVAPYTESLIQPLLASSAKAAASSCGDSGCSFSWNSTTKATDTGVGQQIDALSYVQGLLFGGETASVTNATATNTGSGGSSSSGSTASPSGTSASAASNAAMSTVSKGSSMMICLLGAMVWLAL